MPSRWCDTCKRPMIDSSDMKGGPLAPRDGPFCHCFRLSAELGPEPTDPAEQLLDKITLAVLSGHHTREEQLSWIREVTQRNE